LAGKFLNQKLGKRNTRRANLLKGKAYSQPSAAKPRASKDSGAYPAKGADKDSPGML
jgi:hypothetical protein